MKLTKVAIGERNEVTATIEMDAGELYRLADLAQASAEAGGNYTKVRGYVLLADHLGEIEKQISATYQTAEKAVKDGTLEELRGTFTPAA